LQKFYANGKLLLTGEYLVLDGAQALALPTKHGQGLVVEKRKEKGLKWESYDEYGKPWFQHNYPHFNTESEDAIVERLRLIMKAVQTLNPSFKHDNTVISTHLTFPRDWGLGTSSTLISLISQWTNVDPYELLQKTFGGSGYDIACATAGTPIIYQLEKKADKIVPTYQPISFDPSFKEQLYFVYLGKKQNSHTEIKRYKAKNKDRTQAIKSITEITQQIQNVNTLLKFEILLKRHERIVAKQIGLPTIHSKHFDYYWGAIKSLGAWGGDFVLATSHKSYEETKAYFNEKGFQTFLRYEEVILEESFLNE